MTTQSAKPGQQVSPEILDRLPPQDLDAERAVLGSILLRQDVLDDVGGTVTAGDFYSDSNRKLFKHLVAMHENGEKVDIVTLRDKLRAAGHLEVIGGAVYLAEVVSSVPYAANAVYYAGIVTEKAKLRAVIATASNMLRNAYAGGGKADEVFARAQEALTRAEDRGHDADLIDAATAVGQAMDRAREVRDNKRGGGLLTGLADFDWQIGGLFPGELVVLAARPRMGKTSLGIQIMAHCATRNRPVLFASLEMSAVELVTRMLCGRAGVDSNRLRTGAVEGGDIPALENEAEKLRDATFSILDRPALTTADIRREARRLQRRSGLRLVVVDYLQRLTPADARVKRHEQVGQMTRDLKRLARELEVPVLLLAQLNRELESTADHRPRLSHLRESGDIEQDADVVAFLHRAEVYKPSDPDLHGQAELIVEKNRSGPTAKLELLWNAQTTTLRTPSLVPDVPWEGEEFDADNH